VSRLGRLQAESRAASRAFLRRRTAVFFTFFFPLIIVVIFGVLVQTRPGGGGLFTREPAYYVPGYLAVVVLFTPLSRVGSEVARHRDGNRFEKLATTPLTRPEWLLAQTLVNTVVIGLAGLVLLGLMVVLTGAEIVVSPLLVPFVVLGVVLFCGVGAMLGSLASSQDGVISASNGIALPLLFLSETFVPPELLPAWFPTWLSPLTYFSRGVRSVSTGGGDLVVPLAVLSVCAVVSFGVGAALLPRTD
jgi:ABC-2 type transport system permease protein